MIDLKNISYNFPDTESQDPVIKNISLGLKEGSFNVLVGRSGCGKSTLLRLLAHIIEPRMGEMVLPDSISMVFQGGTLLPWLSVYENLRITHASKRTIEEELSKMKILDLKDSYPRNLSGGQRQRVGIARALVVKPKLLLLDEPFSALDSDTARNLREELLSIWRRTGMTILMVSHSIEEAVLLADKVIIMKSGQIADEMSFHQERPRNEEDPNILGFARRIKKMI
jgi:ABC-type nitrate/sulfonate/bicarbonate transport system ATPase subunit